MVELFSVVNGYSFLFWFLFCKVNVINLFVLNRLNIRKKNGLNFIMYLVRSDMFVFRWTYIKFIKKFSVFLLNRKLLKSNFLIFLNK